jgi:nucleotide-binding universal stress UspA family protein
MAKRAAAFPLLIATDGSEQARAAIATAIRFPWPPSTRPIVVVARGGVLGSRWPTAIGAGVDRELERVALRGRQALQARWPEVEIAIVDQSPVDGILAQARRRGAKAIVVGFRGKGAIARFVLGSVSRGVVRRAACPVLVVKGRPRTPTHVLIGLDGSANARRAVDFVASLETSPGVRATLLRIIEPVRAPSAGVLPATVRAAVGAQAAALEAQQRAAAQRDVEGAGSQLARAGWTVRTMVRTGVPLPELLRAVGAVRADVLTLGARGVGGLERALLGSVADGALSHSPVSVLIVK